MMIYDDFSHLLNQGLGMPQHIVHKDGQEQLYHPKSSSMTHWMTGSRRFLYIPTGPKLLQQ